MKKITFLLVLVATLFVTMNVSAQGKNDKLWMMVNMDEVEQYGGNTDYDNDTFTASFTGNYNRWFDLPGVKGDLTAHTKITFEILKSDCVMKVSLRYKDANGKTQQVTCQTFYSSMGKEISAKKLIKCDLSNGGKITEEKLKNAVAVRISMAKPSTDKSEPWSIQFGNVCVY